MTKINSEDNMILDALQAMIEQAPKIGLCAMPFKVIYERVVALVAENNILRQIVYPDYSDT